MNNRLREAFGQQLTFSVDEINGVKYFIYKTRTRKVAFVRKFLCEPSIKSRAAYLWLIEKLRVQDVNWKEVRKRSLRLKAVKQQLFQKHIEQYGSLTCEYCGRPRLYPTPPPKRGMNANQYAKIATADHFIPTSRGGSSTEENLRVACMICNKVKKDMTFEEFEIKCADHLRGHRKKFNFRDLR